MALGFDRVELTAGAGTDYRLLSMQVQESVAPSDASFLFNVSGTDADGDPGTALVAVNVDANSTTGGTAGADTMTGTTAADTLVGGDGNDIINGNDSNDVLFGSAGNDSISGGNGNDSLYGDLGEDTLVGGVGNDILTGGDSSDTFKIAAVGEAGDTIKDFAVASVASGGDKLDVSDLIGGADSSLAGLQGAPSS